MLASKVQDIFLVGKKRWQNLRKMLYVHDIWEMCFPITNKSSLSIYPKKERKKDDLTVPDPFFFFWNKSLQQKVPSLLLRHTSVRQRLLD